MSEAKKVLFIGHDASRTGAPLLLLELIRWLVSNSTLLPSVLLKRGGELESDYRMAAPTHCYADERQAMNRKLHRRLLRGLGISAVGRPSLARQYPLADYPLVYANTIAACDLALRMIKPGRRLVHHIHELNYTTDVFGAREVLQKAVPVTDTYIAASHAVQEYLERTIGVPKAKIQVIHEFPIFAHRSGIQPDTRQVLRRQLGISESSFVIGMCGLPQWRKGTDLFVQLALHVKRRAATARYQFVWLGGAPASHLEPLHDVARLGLQDMVRFIPAVSNPEDYYGAFDILALTSREDPFPVAMLEAALSGLPIVCFAGAGGAPELVEDDAGVVVPYLDLPAMAQACTELAMHESRRLELGDNARTKVLSRYLLATQGPKILAVVEALLR